MIPIQPNRRARVVLIALAVAGASILAGCSSSDGATATTSTTAKAAPTTTTGSGTDSTPPPRSSTTTSEPSESSNGGDGATAKPAAIGTYGVGLASFDFEDTSRPTPANGSAKGHPGRDLPVLVWYPSEAPAGGPVTGQVADGVKDAKPHGGRFPVVLFSHGLTGKATFYGAVTRAWASAGYVVIAPDYPLSKLDTPGKPTAADVGQQPADASYVLDRFLAKTAKQSPEVTKIAGHVDGGHIAAAGHSLGGVTSLGLGYATCCEDDRVDAVADFAGLLLPLLDKPSPDPKVTDLPLLIIHGTSDGTVPYARSEKVFKQIDDPRWFITLPGGEHIPPYVTGRNGAQATLVVDASLDFFDAELKGDPTGIDRMEAAVTTAGPKVATIESAKP